MAKKVKEHKPCKMCEQGCAIEGEKYCKSCKKVVMSEMKASGYLTNPRPENSVREQSGRRSISSSTISGSSEIGSDGDDN
jgi:hypothetical protein